jgi:hypothetical protein
MDKQFFDECAILDYSTIPEKCIEDCSQGGRDATPYCEDWLDRLGFSVSQELARKALKGDGAWDDLETASDREIALRVLWLACTNKRETLDNDEALFILE